MIEKRGARVTVSTDGDAFKHSVRVSRDDVVQLIGHTAGTRHVRNTASTAQRTNTESRANGYSAYQKYRPLVSKKNVRPASTRIPHKICLHFVNTKSEIEGGDCGYVLFWGRGGGGRG